MTDEDDDVAAAESFPTELVGKADADGILRTDEDTNAGLTLGDGIPLGYESTKISSWEPFLKLYMSRYLGGAYVPSNIFKRVKV